MISATVIADSTNWLSYRLTTLVLIYPRFIHSEFMTHRVLSKNATSTRGMPSSKFADDVRDNTAMPMWTLNRKGMTGERVTDLELIERLDADWIFSRDFCLNEAGALSMAGVHKQHANRILEPFQHIRVICSGTEWDNFFALRDHPDAMPEIQVLAQEIKKAMEISIPITLDPGDWHMPFGDNIQDTYSNNIKVATARCARVSYNNFNGESKLEDDLRLYDHLVGSNPKHLSPTEHIARVPEEKELRHFASYYSLIGLEPKFYRGKYVSNLNGWIQFRKIIEDNEKEISKIKELSKTKNENTNH